MAWTAEYRKQYCREYYQRNKQDWYVRFEAKRKGTRLEEFRAANLKKKYNLSVAEYNQMVKQQNGLCKVCKKPETALDKRTNKIKNLAVDHCHKTGKVRGLLCSGCNGGLGLFKDNKDALLAAVEYLKDTQCE